MAARDPAVEALATPLINPDTSVEVTLATAPVILPDSALIADCNPLTLVPSEFFADIFESCACTIESAAMLPAVDALAIPAIRAEASVLVTDATAPVIFPDRALIADCNPFTEVPNEFFAEMLLSCACNTEMAAILPAVDANAKALTAADSSVDVTLPVPPVAEAAEMRFDKAWMTLCNPLADVPPTLLTETAST